jgi:sulfatase maturation enzyme AslB (radical SAM superfamily)
MEPRAKIMDGNLAEYIIKTNPELERVNLNNWGEPLIHPYFPSIIEMINMYIPTCKVYFSTNGTLFRTSTVHKIFKNKVHEIQVSLDGVDDVYKTVRGIKYSVVFGKVREMVLYRNRIKSPTRVVLKAVVNEQTESEISKLIDEWESLVDEVRLQPEIKYGSGKRRVACPELFNGHLVVLTDGRVVPCCADYNGKMCVGNVYESSLIDILSGERMDYLQRLHLAGAYPPFCAGCVEYESNLCKRRFG